MANLEFIRYIPVREITNGESLSWELDKMAKVVDGLPQLGNPPAKPAS